MTAVIVAGFIRNGELPTRYTNSGAGKQLYAPPARRSRNRPPRSRARAFTLNSLAKSEIFPSPTANLGVISIDFAIANFGNSMDSRTGFRDEVQRDMFKFFKHRDRAAKTAQKLAVQREMERRRAKESQSDSTLRANIANKLKGYNAEEDTTISNFTLADDEVERNLLKNPAPSKGQDVWSQANPRESGRWKKENR